jgi:hypothetical protein
MMKRKTLNSTATGIDYALYNLKCKCTKIGVEIPEIIPNLGGLWVS